MGEYIVGIIASFCNPILHGWANILDSYFSNKIFSRLSTLIFFSELTNLIFLPIVFIIDFPKIIPLGALVIVILIALIEIIYQYPYYHALRKGDTSIVASLFSLGKIFIPLFAFLLVRERLTNAQYIGFFIVVTASIFLTLDLKKLKLNEVFFLMVAVSIVLSLQTVLYKYLFGQGVSWGSAVVWTGIAQFILASLVLLWPGNLKDFSVSRGKIREIGPLFFLAQMLSWGGSAIGDYAIFLIPVSLVNGIGSTQSIFVLLFAILFTKRAPTVFKEYLGSESIWKKGVAFAFMILGTVLIAVP